MKKLTKAQREFFKRFVADTVVNVITQIAPEELRQDYTDVGRIVVENMMKDCQLDSLVEATGNAILEQVPFKTVKKVDAFMNSEEFRKTMQVTSCVVSSGDLREEYIGLIGSVGETAEKLINDLKNFQEEEEAPV